MAIDTSQTKSHTIPKQPRRLVMRMPVRSRLLVCLKENKLLHILPVDPFKTTSLQSLTNLGFFEIDSTPRPANETGEINEDFSPALARWMQSHVVSHLIPIFRCDIIAYASYWRSACVLLNSTRDHCRQPHD